MADTRVTDAIASFPSTFQLRTDAVPFGNAADMFRISPSGSYVNDADDVQLVLERSVSGQWLEYGKVYIAELSDFIELPEPQSSTFLRDEVPEPVRAHSWCFGGDVALCPTCTAHMDAFNQAIAAHRPVSNILRGDIRTFNIENIPTKDYRLCVSSFSEAITARDELASQGINAIVSGSGTLYIVEYTR